MRQHVEDFPLSGNEHPTACYSLAFVIPVMVVHSNPPCFAGYGSISRGTTYHDYFALRSGSGQHDDSWVNSYRRGRFAPIAVPLAQCCLEVDIILDMRS